MSRILLDDKNEYYSDGPVVFDEFLDRTCLHGHNEGPTILFDLFFAGTIDEDHLEEIVYHAWSTSDYPANSLEPEAWKQIFASLDFKIEAPIKLWRGSDNPRGMSWTGSKHVAERFTNMQGRPAGQVYDHVFDPKYILGYTNDREEDEYIVDPDYMKNVTVVQGQFLGRVG